MSDDSDDPVMALLATQRAVLAAVENLADPELRAAQGNYMVAQAIAKGLNKADPDGEASDVARVREWIADQLDRGRVFEPAKVRDGGKGALAVVEPIHEEMFPGRVRVQRRDRER